MPPSPITGTPTATTSASLPPGNNQISKPDLPKLLPGTTPTDEFNVRLAGDDVQGIEALYFNIGRLRAVSDGVELPVTRVEPSVDLAFEGNAWLIGRVQVPKSATQVSFLLELDDFGGYQHGSDAASVDARAVPIVWTSQVDWLRHRGHAVVHLDVAKSLTPSSEGLRLLPRMQVLH